MDSQQQNQDSQPKIAVISSLRQTDPESMLAMHDPTESAQLLESSYLEYSDDEDVNMADNREVVMLEQKAELRRLNTQKVMLTIQKENFAKIARRTDEALIKTKAELHTMKKKYQTCDEALCAANHRAQILEQNLYNARFQLMEAEGQLEASRNYTRQQDCKIFALIQDTQAQQREINRLEARLRVVNTNINLPAPLYLLTPVYTYTIVSPVPQVRRDPASPMTQMPVPNTPDAPMIRLPVTPAEAQIKQEPEQVGTPLACSSMIETKPLGRASKKRTAPSTKQLIDAKFSKKA